MEISSDGQNWAAAEEVDKNLLPTIHPTAKKGFERVTYGTFDPLPISGDKAQVRLRVQLKKTGDSYETDPVFLTPASR